MNSFAGRDHLRRYRNLLIATSDDMLRYQLCRLIAEQERQELLHQISEQQSPVASGRGVASILADQER